MTFPIENNNSYKVVAADINKKLKKKQSFISPTYV